MAEQERGDDGGISTGSAVSRERSSADHRTPLGTYVAISSFFIATIIAVISSLAPWVSMRPGEFLGIAPEHWLVFWGSVLGAVLSAAVAVIIVLIQGRSQAKRASADRKQQAEVARLDRVHQAEMARQAREIDSVSELHGAIQEFLNAQSNYFENGEWWDGTTHEARPSLLGSRVEIAAHKWRMNSGLGSKLSLDTVNVLLQLCYGYVYSDELDNKIRFMDYERHLILSISKMMQTTSSTLDNKASACQKIIDEFNKELHPRHQERIRAFEYGQETAQPEHRAKGKTMPVEFWPHGRR